MAAKSWNEIVAASLDWGEAHGKLEDAVGDFPAALRGRRPDGSPHSPWELLEHIRIAQRDLLDFCTNKNYQSTLKWPDDYWPKSPAPNNDAEWTDTVSAILRDRSELKSFLVHKGDAATSAIPWGEGQTFLRTVLLAVDHSAYHLGQLILVRALLGAWPPAGQSKTPG